MQTIGLFLAILIGSSAAGPQAPAQPAPAAPAKPAPAQPNSGTPAKPAPQPPAQAAPQTATQAPRRAAGAGAARSGSVTFAVRVSDPAGQPIAGVKVSLEGAAQRQASTEGGRIAFENLPAGNYLFRFEHEGFITLERELVARGGAPIDVKVTLTPAPEPPPPPPAPEPPPAATPPPADPNAEPTTIDLPAFISKNFVGGKGQKISALACSGMSTASLIQLHDPLTEHAHADFDELLYVIAGQGIARMQGHDQPLSAGVFVMIPRGLPHSLAAGGRNPLVMLSVRPGDHCQSGGGSGK
jgi:mannose-6-phosphate isomerase-like protein (cupin superfamily)